MPSSSHVAKNIAQKEDLSRPSRDPAFKENAARPSKVLDTEKELQKMLKVLEEEYISIREDLIVLRPKYRELHHQAKSVLNYSDADAYFVFVANVYMDVLYGFAQEYCCAIGDDMEKFRRGRMTESLQHPCRKYNLETTDERKRVAKLSQFCGATTPAFPSTFEARLLKLTTYSGFGGSKLIAYLVMYMFALLWPSYEDGKVVYKNFTPDVQEYMSYTNPANGYIESKLGLTNDKAGFSKLSDIILDSGLHPQRVRAFSKMDLQHLLCDTWGKRGLLKKCTCEDSVWETWKFQYYRRLAPEKLVPPADQDFRDSTHPKKEEASGSSLRIPGQREGSAAENSVGSSTWRSRRRTQNKVSVAGYPERCMSSAEGHDYLLQHHESAVRAPSLKAFPGGISSPSAQAISLPGFTPQDSSIGSQVCPETSKPSEESHDCPLERRDCELQIGSARTPAGGSRWSRSSGLWRQ